MSPSGRRALTLMHSQCMSWTPKSGQPHTKKRGLPYSPHFASDLVDFCRTLGSGRIFQRCVWMLGVAVCRCPRSQGQDADRQTENGPALYACVCFCGCASSPPTQIYYADGWCIPLITCLFCRSGSANAVGAHYTARQTSTWIILTWDGARGKGHHFLHRCMRFSAISSYSQLRLMYRHPRTFQCGPMYLALLCFSDPPTSELQ